MKSPHEIRPELIVEVAPDFLCMLRDIHDAEPIKMNRVYASTLHGVLLVDIGNQRLFIRFKPQDMKAMLRHFSEFCIEELVACMQYGLV